MVFARNLDEKQSRYRHPKTEDFTLLTWTFNVDLLLNLQRKKDGSNSSLLTSYFGLGSRTESVSTPESEEPSTGTQVSVFNSRDFCIFAHYCKAKRGRSPQNKA